MNLLNWIKQFGSAIANKLSENDESPSDLKNKLYQQNQLFSEIARLSDVHEKLSNRVELLQRDLTAFGRFEKEIQIERDKLIREIDDLKKILAAFDVSSSPIINNEYISEKITSDNREIFIKEDSNCSGEIHNTRFNDGRVDGNKNENLDYKYFRSCASDYVEQLARQGNGIAQYEIGKRKLRGEGGVEQDVDEAMRWLERASARSEIAATILLGIIHWKGLANEVNRMKAWDLIDIAAESGNPTAVRLLKTLELELFSDIADEADHKSPASSTKAYRSQHTSINLADGAYDGVPRDKLDAKLYLLGVKRGNACLRVASKTENNGNLPIDEMANRIAKRRGYLDIGIDRGMVGLIDGADPDFDQRREVFINGVNDGLGGVDADEIEAEINAKQFDH
jgi:hypothetical protein